MRRLHGNLRLAALLAGSLAAACGESSLAPEVTGVTPAEGFTSASTPVTIHGRFDVEPFVSYRDAARSTVNASFSAWLDDDALLDVHYVDHGSLSATVPPGLALGEHPLRVQDSVGRTATLAGAFRVVDCPWLDDRHPYRSKLTVRNTAGVTAPEGTTVVARLNRQPLIARGVSREDGADLAVAFCEPTGAPRRLAWVDARQPDGTSSFDTTSDSNDAQLAFALAAPIGAEDEDDRYYLYYGDMDALPQTADPGSVYRLFEPFDDLDRWRAHGGATGSTDAGALVLTAEPGQVLYGDGPLLEDGEGVGIAVRARAMQDQDTGELVPLGWRLSEASGERFDLAAGPLGNRVRYWPGWDAATGEELAGDGASSPPDAARWYVYEVRLRGSHVEIWRDGTRLASAERDAAAGSLFVGAEGVTGRWDWLLVRLWVDPEPTVTVGNEQTR